MKKVLKGGFKEVFKIKRLLNQVASKIKWLLKSSGFGLLNQIAFKIKRLLKSRSPGIHYRLHNCNPLCNAFLVAEMCR
jgi:hypothetical protein